MLYHTDKQEKSEMYGEDRMTDHFEYLPLSSSQMNIWNLEMAHPGLSMNNICTALKIEGNLDLEHLWTCIRLAFQAFPSLRTRITIRDGKPCQFVAKEIPLGAAFFDFTETDEQGIQTWFQSVAREQFALLDHPLCQMMIFKTSENSGGIYMKVHHIIADAWSHALVTNHIIHNYFQLLSGQEGDATPTGSYREHVLSEQKYLQSKAFEKDKKFWKEKLRDISPGVVKEHQCALLSPVGLRKSCCFSNRLNRLIGGFCEKEKVSPFAVFYMGLAVYLRRMKGQKRFCIGVPTINRLNFKEKQTGGMFVNTLPFVNELDISMTWNEFNEKLREDWLSLLCHQRIPFESIKQLAGESSQDGGPLFDIVLSYQNGKMDHLRGARVSLEGRWYYSGYQSEALCIHLSSRDKENQFVVDYDYLTQIFSEQEIEHLHHAISRILKRALLNPDIPISSLPILDEESEERVIYDFNQTDNWYDREKNIAEKMAENVLLYPDRAALIFQGKRTSYQELGNTAVHIARQITTHIKAENRTVAVHMRRSDSLFAALAGIIYSGNHWLLIDTKLPVNRKKLMLKDSGAALCITEDVWEAEENFSFLLFQELSMGSEVKADDFYRAAPKDLAYLVYTSGSTGEPKAVEIEQHSVLNLADALKHLYPKGAVLSICNVGFDAFLLESVLALLNGRTIVIASEEEMNHPIRIGQLIHDYDVGFMALTPSRLSAYMKEEVFRKALPHLETIICGGESLPPQLYQQIHAHTTASLYNQYGPSEATVAVSHAKMNGKDAVSIGAPLQNCRIYILDEFKNPLPPGCEGEIYIGGECLARGYHNREELTRDRFLEDPFVAGKRIYRTGDFGKWSEDGNIFYLGRKDQQVKLLGHRIELSEIESVLMRHPSVDTAAVTVWEGRLLAYFTGRPSLGEEELLTYAAAYLPRYLLPAALIKKDVLPLTGNGKTDFARLEKPELPDSTEGPADEVEERLLTIWKRVLKRDGLGVYSDYFQSGGDSLNAVQMLLEVEKEFSRTLTVSELYGCSTLRRLGSLIRGKALEKTVPDSEIKRAENQDWYPLTPSQAGFYVLHELDGTRISYNMPTAFELSEWLEFPRLEQAFCKMIEEDPVLRTTFHMEAGNVIAKVNPALNFQLGWMETDTIEEAMRDFVRPFDLAEGPLLRAAMVKLPENRPGLILDMHHIISDGLSSQLLLSRLHRYYQGLSVSLPEVTFVDYAWWRKHKEDEGRNPSREFWEEQFKEGLPNWELPSDRPRPSVFDGKGAQYLFRLPEEWNDKLNAYCEQHHVTVFMLLLSMYGLLLSRCSGADKVVVGTPFSGRRRQKLEDMTGVFVNTLPVCLNTDPEMTMESYLASVCQTVTNMLDHQEISLEELAEIAAVERRRDRNPLFTTLFTMTPLKAEEISIGSAGLTYVPYETHAVKMDLNLEVTFLKGGYQFRFEYAKSLFDEVTIAFYSRCMVQGLASILEDCDRRLKEIEILDMADRIRLLERPRRMRTPYDAATVDQMMDETALLRPERTAVRWGRDICDTYADLKYQSDLLAAALRSAGVQRGDKVAFLTRRTGLLPVLMFGILKTGAAYVPIDPTFPKERIRYMLEQAEVRLAVYGQAELVLEGIGCEALIWEEEQMRRTRIESTSSQEHGGEDAANVIFTSGTTGRPKGVVMLHKSLSNLAAHLEPLLGTCREVILCASNCVFDVFTTETILALAKGYTISIADEQEMVLPWKMAERIIRDKVTVLQLTPSRIQMCLGDENFRSALRGIHRIILLGEPWGMELKDRLRSLTDARIFNIYGPTETSVHNCQGDITESDSIHIGKPIGNCRYYLLDKHRKPVLPTAVGEIYIAGECLSAGYINQPELTEEVFVPDDILRGERMYRTGDLGRLRADGNWQCLGRVDTQVKLDGHRIEPMEISELMLQSGMVREAAVVPVYEDGAPAYLRAAFVKAEGYEEAAMREYLAKELPDYMIPSEFLELDELPRTSSGKTDVKKLAVLQIEGSHELQVEVGHEPQLEADEEWSSKADQELQSVSEEELQAETFKNRPSDRIKELWTEVLGREPNPDVSFFEQGGTSLKAILVLNRYHQEQYGFDLNDFYRHPTLREQTAILTGREHQMPGEENSVRRLGSETKDYMVPRRLTVQTEQILRPGGILLTGATGYLGSHILKKLLEYGNEEIYCLIRGEEERLIKVLNLYFQEGFYEKYRERLHIMTGELAKERFALPKEQYEEMAGRVTRVFHCAADVRHYAVEAELYHANVEGTMRVLEFAEASGAALMHMSTISTAGSHLLEKPKEPYTFSEMDLDVGQDWQENPYVKSKVLAEKAVDDAVQKGLHASIFRIGRLAANSYNGRFQKNPQSNAYYRLVKGILELGVLSDSLYQHRMELTPVNEAAEAVVRLSGSVGGAYHIYSPYEVKIGSLVKACRPVERVTEEEFANRLKQKSIQSDSPYIQALAQTWFEAGGLQPMVRVSQEKTLEKLAELDFWWREPRLEKQKLCFLEERSEDRK